MAIELVISTLPSIAGSSRSRDSHDWTLHRLTRRAPHRKRHRSVTGS
jgi:hypothetical protein